MLVPIGKRIELDVDPTRFNRDVMEHVVKIGLRNILRTRTPTPLPNPIRRAAKPTIDGVERKAVDVRLLPVVSDRRFGRI